MSQQKEFDFFSKENNKKSYSNILYISYSLGIICFLMLFIFTFIPYLFSNQSDILEKQDRANQLEVIGDDVKLIANNYPNINHTYIKDTVTMYAKINNQKLNVTAYQHKDEQQTCSIGLEDIVITSTANTLKEACNLTLEKTKQYFKKDD